jgi:hypothetical protein
VETQPEKTSPASDKPSFFGPPARWMGFGRMFWGGVVMGIGIGGTLGFLIGAALVAEGIIPSQPNRFWHLLVIALLPAIATWIGRAIAGPPARR